MSSWPVRDVFRILVAATVLACLATAGAVVKSHVTRQELREDYAVVVRASDDVRVTQTLAVQMAQQNLVSRWVPGQAKIAAAARDQALADIRTRVADATALPLPPADRALITAIFARYQELDTWLIQVSRPSSAAGGKARGIQYRCGGRPARWRWRASRPAARRWRP